jgi:alpha-beta hydrolase superfamily lysophospholipase
MKLEIKNKGNLEQALKEIELQGQKKGKRKGRRIKKILIITVSILLFLFFITLLVLPPVIMNDMVNLHVDFKETFHASDYNLTAKDLELTTSDGVKISAHEVYTENPKAVIIIISGIHNPSVTAFYGHAKFFKEHGYASILYDMRAHGDSEGDTVCLGYKEHLDTKAVVEYIKADDRYQEVPIVVFGVSMGGATAINSIGEISEIDGLISSSAYASWEDAFYDNMVYMGAPKGYAFVQKPFVKLYTNLKYGFDTAKITPEKEIKKLGDRPALIMHSKGDTQVPYRSYEQIMKNAPEHVETWVREGDLHFIVQEEAFDDPDKDPEYAETILSFLDTHFNN